MLGVDHESASRGSGATSRPAAIPGDRYASSPAPLTVDLAPAQDLAVGRAIRILERRGGVLLADRTGTGKTFLAIAIIESALAGGARRVLVTGPAAIRPQWLPLLKGAAAAHGATVPTRARTARATATTGPAPPWQPDAGPVSGPTITWLSHAALSRGTWPADLDVCDLVVVDEAHRFRNPATRRYRTLAWLGRSGRIVLLTATPVNNSMLDLYFLLRLFLGDGALSDLGVPDLAAAFRSAAETGGPVRPPLDAAINAVVVRTARHLSRRTAADSGFSRPAPAPDRPWTGPRPGRVLPVTVKYDLDRDCPGLARFLVETVRQLDLAPHHLARSGEVAGGGELPRFALLKRLESSIAAFNSSIRAMLRYLTAFRAAARDGFWLSPAAHRALCAAVPDQLLLAPLALPRLPPPFEPDRIVASAGADIGRLRQAIDRLALLRGPADPKAARLLMLLNGPLRNTKVLVFTEFRDTATHLWRLLRDRHRVGLIHGGHAMLGAGQARRRDVVTRFAPVANGLAACATEQEVDILIATDVLAEGFNLQDAAHVVSYDLPWNPVRLIQRVGRIDRTGSSHEVVRCHNFMPDRVLDLFLGLVDRINAKLEAIRAGPGGGATGLVATRHRRPARPTRSTRVRPLPIAAPTRLLRRLESGDPGLFTEFEEAADLLSGGAPCGARPHGESWTGCGDTLREMDAGPIAGRVSADGRDEASGGCAPSGLWIAALADGASIRLLLVRRIADRQHVREDPIVAARLLDRLANGRLEGTAFTRPGCAGDSEEPCDVRYSGPGQTSVVAAVVAEAAADHLTEAGKPGAGSITPVIRKLLRIVAREPGGPDPALLGRIDVIVGRLRAGVRSGLEARVVLAVDAAGSRRRAHRPGAAADLVSQLDAILESSPPVHGHTAHGTRNVADPCGACGPVVLAVVEVTGAFDPRLLLQVEPT